MGGVLDRYPKGFGVINVGEELNIWLCSGASSLVLFIHSLTVIWTVCVPGMGGGGYDVSCPN